MTSNTVQTLPWKHSFKQLGGSYYSEVVPTPLTSPYWIHINPAVQACIGLNEGINSDEALAIFSGNATLSHQMPIAMVYAGHQFGGYSPQLGDGRGLLLGQIDTSNGLVDIHLKGAGKTPYSRFGDGRAVLRSSIREYLAGETMHALGIASSRALCIVGSADSVQRETEETAAMVARVAKTHIRFGHFEYFYYQNKHDELKTLADHVIDQFLPEASQQSDRYEQLLRYAVDQTAVMIAHWQSVGFAHGVMNTDNMSIIGETLDYGPYGFLDDYEPGFICNHSDHQGRYAFDQQPSIGLWNLNALAHAFSPMIETEKLSDILSHYENTLVSHYAENMRKKFGFEKTHDQDQKLCAQILALMAEDKVDYTGFFRTLSQWNGLTDVTKNHDEEINETLSALFSQQDKWQQWLLDYRRRLRLETATTEQRQRQMLTANPKYILRNYLLQNAIRKAEVGDFSEVDTLFRIMQNPFDEQSEYDTYASPSPTWGKHLPISCSS